MKGINTVNALSHSAAVDLWTTVELNKKLSYLFIIAQTGNKFII